MNWSDIIWAVVWFAIMGAVLGLVLAFAGKKFEVKQDERIDKIASYLPGANCGGCGYTGCSALAEAIVKGDAPADACKATSKENTIEIGKIMGVDTSNSVRYRAQVMCSGTKERTKVKYEYEGIDDCIAAVKLGGGPKECPFGCIGLGTCIQNCKFGAIALKDGVAYVDYSKCTGCGACTRACPKHIIKLIPYDSKHWVGCMSHDKGAQVRIYCEVGCFGCKLCEKNCEAKAITITDSIASIDYSKCTGCNKCVEVCPRHIIWSAESQGEYLAITR